ncbi:hypothetical protein AZI86_01675 [Bdellovibrio bacteriovorus]|uniref:DM13 domain-containing protein n=1 Tax=Bdellovibrio bacteriovorus TaxID=959 RepID=A0A150WN38_BDEBC|nr:DM13 domain-containing protein [Bdellovibrio bacteriovorus]KYG65808.1 hypothetical protein AZI86_01675 [Bdellovibrio bacteriovorus]
MNRLGILILGVCLSNGAYAAPACDQDWLENCPISDENYVGSFMPVGAKRTTGDLSIDQKMGKINLKFARNFETQHGPDLRVVLRDSSGVTPMIVVETLKAFKGEQEYMLPVSAEELTKFDQVVIYCAQFHVDFGIAKIK